MEYTITHSINDNAINIQVIHNKTETYYESFIENTDTHKQIFENINNMELNFHICDTKLFLFFDYNGKSYVFDWSALSENPNAIELLEKNLLKIDWIKLALNPMAGKLFEEYEEFLF